MLKSEIAEIIGAELEAAIAAAVAADGIGTGSRYQMALAFYDGSMPENDDDNDDPHREAVSLDVGDMVEAVFAQLAPSLRDAGGVEFEATGPDDEQQAQKETAIIRAMLLEGQASEGGFVAFTEAIKDALLMRRGALGLWIDRKETRTPEEWRAVPELSVGEISAPNRPGQRIEALSIKPDEEAMEERPNDGELYRVTFDRVDVDKRLAVGAIAPENFVSSSLEERDPDKVRFCADRMVTTRAALVAQGFAEADVAKLKKHDPADYDLYIERTPTASEEAMKAAQFATECVEVWRCYALLSKSKDSPAAERFRVYFGRDGRVILGEPERVGRVCYALGQTMLYPHRMDGVSLFDRIGEVQELKTAALRGWVENLHKVNRPRLGVDETLANLADARDATQDIIRIKGPGALIPIPSLDAGPSVLAFLQYQDQCRSERGGASLDLQTSSAQIATNQTASGIERQYSVKEQLAATMARTFAETAIRGAFLVAHYLLRTSWGGPLATKIGGEWQQADPAQWPVRSGMRVSAAESRSDKQAKAAALAAVMQAQTAWMQTGKGGILADDSKLFNAAHDWLTASQLQSPERYLIDPSSKQAAQARQAQQQQQAAAMQAQGDAARAALMLEKYKTDTDALTKMIEQIVKASIEEAKLTLSPAPLDEAEAAAGAVGESAAAGKQAADPSGGAG